MLIKKKIKKAQDNTQAQGNANVKPVFTKK